MRKHHEVVYGSIVRMILLITLRCESFKFKSRFTNDVSIANVEIAVPLKYSSNFWKTLEMPLINCEINLLFSLQSL